MRLVSFVARTSQLAMAELRAKLGDEAVIVTTQSLENGDVRLTGAVAESDLDLIDVLTPSSERQDFDWLIKLGEFHEWPTSLTTRLTEASRDLAPSEPKTILITLLRSLFRFDALTDLSGKPILLSGPPGSGKSSTIAKLAAAHVLADKTVDVVTMDVERAGALDQLTTLLEPLGLRPKIVQDPSQASSVLAACSSDLVLLDSPGINPYSSKEISGLSTFVDQISAELVLVLEAGRSVSEAAEIGESYAALGAKRMIVTKLDITRRLGGLLAAASAGLAFCGAGIGPTIGDGFRPLLVDGLARLLLRRHEDAFGKEACS